MYTRRNVMQRTATAGTSLRRELIKEMHLCHEEKKMSNLVDHAKSELQRAGLFDEDSDYGGKMAHVVMDMIEQFSEEGHSGMSASMAISLFEKLARFEPLTPLTGEDDEWGDVSQNGSEPFFQNKRCSHVFKESNGKAYDMDAKIFRDPNGVCWTNSESRVYIEFPYTPKREYVDKEMD
jgi:hypothetical protein